MKELPFVVYCKGFVKWFEPIAAFNDRSIALQYARDCKACNTMFEYKVEEIVSKVA